MQEKQKKNNITKLLPVGAKMRQLPLAAAVAVCDCINFFKSNLTLFKAIYVALNATSFMHHLHASNSSLLELDVAHLCHLQIKTHRI